MVLLLVCGGIGWQRPIAALSFVVLGSVPYYAALHLLGVATSGSLTGAIFGTVGIASVARLAARNRGRTNWGALAAFGLFVLLWYFRWFQDPPVASAATGVVEFTARTRVFMVAFAAVPFLGANLILRDADFDELLQWLSFWGMCALGIVLAYWLTDQPNLGPSWSKKWEPIPSLTGTILALDVGMGLLAFLASTDGRRGTKWTGVRVAVMIAASAVTVRVGQRGPFLFLLVTLAGYLLARNSRVRAGSLVATVVMVLAVGGTVMVMSDAFDASPTVQLDNYGAEANENRTGLFRAAFRFIQERPMDGWGGSLVGVQIEGGEWQYVHNFLLDPLVETGVLGALLVWGIVGYAIVALGRRWTEQLSGGTVGTVLVPMFFYAFLEAQVSGHVSGARHLWLLLGMCHGISERHHRSALARTAGNAGAAAARDALESGPPGTPRLGAFPRIVVPRGDRRHERDTPMENDS